MGFDVVGVFGYFSSFFFFISSSDFTFLLKSIHILFPQFFNRYYV